MNVLVLGCGPAGLLAAERAHREGHMVNIVAIRNKSPMPGAQYLHEHIEDLTPYEPHGYICIRKRGDSNGYALKVYGDEDHPVSWDKYDEGYFPAWSLKEAYDRLWERWQDRITSAKIDRSKLAFLAREYDVAFSSIPAPYVCRGGCEFKSQKVWFSPFASQRCPEDTIIYNGQAEDSWYRASVIFGHESTEYASEKAPSEHCMEGFKPTTTNCVCHPKNVIRIGRFGEWNKQVLVHHVWKKVGDALQQMQ